MKENLFITIEGVDGAGKSSHMDDIRRYIEESGRICVNTREPGGTPFAEEIRNHILNTSMPLELEVLLAFASRADNLKNVIFPALYDGKTVICDRFTDSTYAYQGFAEGHPLEHIERLESEIQQGIRPDFTLLFDLPPEISFKRLQGTGKTPDKFESKSLEYFEKVREGYLYLAKREPDRIKIIDSSVSLEDVKKQVKEVVTNFLQQMDCNNKNKFKR